MQLTTMHKQVSSGNRNGVDDDDGGGQRMEGTVSDGGLEDAVHSQFHLFVLFMVCLWL
jgi:hypothetical protein